MPNSNHHPIWGIIRFVVVCVTLNITATEWDKEWFVVAAAAGGEGVSAILNRWH